MIDLTGGENLSGSLQYEFGKRDFSAPAALTPIILNINLGDRLKWWIYFSEKLNKWVIELSGRSL